MTQPERDQRTPSAPRPFVIGQDALDESEARALWEGAAVVRSETTAFGVTGPGAADCLQGLTTNDVLAAPDGTLQYSALLTAKGMLVSDMWIARLAQDDLTLYVPTARSEELLQVLRRSLPPRLARVTDHADGTAVIRLVGPMALEVAARAGYGEIAPGRAERREDQVVARPETDRPFVLQLECAAGAADSSLAALAGAGAAQANPLTLESARIASGWPRIGAEIDDKTLPQEVRFDDLDGLSHTKGCYLGQETVARIHFRGHVNKRIVGLRWTSSPDCSIATIERERRTVGRLTSTMWFAPASCYAGLGMVRREVEIGDQVMAGGAPAHTVALPHDTTPVEP